MSSLNTNFYFAIGEARLAEGRGRAEAAAGEGIFGCRWGRPDRKDEQRVAEGQQGAPGDGQTQIVHTIVRKIRFIRLN